MTKFQTSISRMAKGGLMLKKEGLAPMLFLEYIAILQGGTGKKISFAIEDKGSHYKITGMSKKHSDLVFGYISTNV